MKKILSIVLTFCLVLAAFPVTAFAGGEDDFPPTEPITVLRPGGSHTFMISSEEDVYIDFYSGNEGIYFFQSQGNADVYIEIYDSEGNMLAEDDDSGEGMNFQLYQYVDYRTDVYLKIGSYTEDSTETTVSVNYSEVTSLEVKSWPEKTEYTYEEFYNWMFSLAGLELELTYSDGSVSTWFPDLVPSPDDIYIDLLPESDVFSSGWQTLVFSCYGYTFRYDVFVKEPDFNEAVVTKLPDTTVYYVDNTAFEPIGMVIELRKDGEPVRTIEFTEDSYYWNIIFDYEEFKLGENTINILIYDICVATLTVTAIENNIKSIDILTLPSKLEYYYSENLYIDPTGMVLRVNYTDGTYFDTEPIERGNDFINGYYLSVYPADWEIFGVGTNEIVVDYLYFVDSYEITVKPNPIERIELLTYPDRTNYFVGEGFVDLSGATLSIAYTDGSAETLDLYHEFMSGNPLLNLVWPTANITEGRNEFGIVYNGFATSFFINGINNDVKRVTVDSPPNNTTLPIGTLITPEHLDGLILNVLYNDGTAEKWDYTYNSGLFMGVDTYPKFYHHAISHSLDAVCLSFGNVAAYVYFNGTDVTPGDLDGDGEITVADALTALRIAAKLATATAEELAIGDIDADGEITVSDALAILRIAAKLA